MTVAVQTNRNVYNGDGVTTGFDFNFYCVDPTWIHVTVDGSPVSPASIVLNIDQSVSPGGHITFTTAPPVGTGNVIFQRAVPLTQLFNYQYLDSFPAVSHMGALDKLTAEVQDLAYQLSLSAIPPFTIANADQYLQVNDTGDGLRWNDPLPKPYVTGLFLAATSPTTVAWAPGGGGGGGMILGPFDTTPNADGLTIDGLLFNVLHLAAADDTHPGGLSTTGQTVGGLKRFVNGAAVSVFDVRNYGAVANDPTNDLAPAFYAACLAATQTQNVFPLNVQGPFAAVYIPTGSWYTSSPLCPSQGLEIYGDGPQLTVIYPGIGTGSDANVPGFAGPVIYGAIPYTATSIVGGIYVPVFGASLATGPGQALQLFNNATTPNAYVNSTWLHDSYAWGTWFGSVPVTAFSIQFFWKVTEAPDPGSVPLRGLLQSKGPTQIDQTFDSAWGLTPHHDGVNWKLRANLTTNSNFTSFFNPQPSGTMVTIDSGNLTLNHTYYVEISYNGAFFDFYLDGVNQGHVSATGAVCRTPWEGVSIGASGPEWLEPIGATETVNGFIDSIRLSNIARHTGTGSYTPPTTKHTWDGNTMALYNWDQGFHSVTPAFAGSTPLVLPCTVGQTLATVGQGSYSTPVTTGPLPHFLRFHGNGYGSCNHYRDFAINGFQGCSGLITSNADRNEYDQVWVTQTSYVGIKDSTGNGFYNKFNKNFVGWSHGYGIMVYGTATNCQTISSAIGLTSMAGIIRVDVFDHQPSFSVFCDNLVLGAGTPSDSQFFRAVTTDAEANIYTRRRAVTIVAQNAPQHLNFEQCFYDTSFSTAPAFLYYVSPVHGVTHTGDVFVTNTDGNGGVGLSADIIHFGATNTTNSKVQLNDCVIWDLNIPKIPLSNDLTQIAGNDNGRQFGVGGLSITSVQANNLTGEFTIQDTYDHGGPVFLVEEPDANYDVVITAKSFSGVPPAAGSNRIVSYQTFTNGFRAFVEVAPGAGCLQTYSYVITRTNAPPALFIHAPSTGPIVNPFAALPAGSQFAFGLTLRPANGKCLTTNFLDGEQTLVSTGLTIPAANAFTCDIFNFAYAVETVFGSGAGSGGIQAVVRNGKLLCPLTAGAHNYVWAYDGLTFHLYFDGTFVGNQVSSGLPGFAQQSHIWLGERQDLSQPLVCGSIFNFKMDQNPLVCLSNDNDIGPDLMDQAVFLGDEYTLGRLSHSANGSWAQRKATASYGTTFYHMAALFNGSVMSAVAGENVFNDLWKPWGGISTSLSLTGASIMLGLHDIIADKSAANIWTTLQEMIEGSPGTNTWIPPTSILTPVDQRAIVVAKTPLSAGTGHFIVNGTAVNAVFNIDRHTSAQDFKNTLDTTPAISSVFTTQLQESPPGSNLWGVILTTRAPGANGLVVSTDGGAGTYVFGDIGGNQGAALSAATYQGFHVKVVINGRSFNADFDTDADTTVNNLITAILADGPTAAIVTPTLVSHRMLLTANTVGAVTNYSLAGSNLFNGSSWVSVTHPVQTLVGGSNGVASVALNTALCTVPPIPPASFTSGRETQRLALNTSIRGYVHAGVFIYDMAADSASGGIAKVGTPSLIAVGFDAGDGTMNDAGHTQVLAGIGGLLP